MPANGGAGDTQALGHGGARPGSGPKSARASRSESFDILAEARAKREVYAADMAEMECLRRRGELISRTEVAENWAALVAIAKGRLLVLPQRLAPALASAGDMPTIERILGDGIREILEELSAGGGDA